MSEHDVQTILKLIAVLCGGAILYLVWRAVFGPPSLSAPKVVKKSVVVSEPKQSVHSGENSPLDDAIDQDLYFRRETCPDCRAFPLDIISDRPSSQEFLMCTGPECKAKFKAAPA